MASANSRANSAFTGAERLLEPGVIDQARLAWRLFRDPRVPAIKNAVPAIAALYLLSPVDVLPDFLVGIGQIDDLGLLIAFLIATIKLLPKLAPADVVAEHRADLFGAQPGSGRRSAGAPARSEAQSDVIEGRFSVRK